MTPASIAALSARLRRYGFTDTPDAIDALAARCWPQKYGRRNIAKMRDEINELRRACRDEGSPRIQAALDAVEPHLCFAYGASPVPDRGHAGGSAVRVPP